MMVGLRQWGVSVALLWSLGGMPPARAEAAESVDRPTLEVRREYNQVAAAIDTIVRAYGRDRIEALTAPDPGRARLPAGSRVVFLFWADDEAEVYLNGNPLSRTRLTPTRVEVPPMYLQTDNEIRAHCWDTDRVESGFTAGLYVETAGGQLFPVLTTVEGKWSAEGGKAQEIYYTHSQPEIPGARVMWGDRLFGEVWLVARFSAASVAAAPGGPPAAPAILALDDRPMEFHEAVARLVRLEQRRRELGAVLAAGHRPFDPSIRFRGAPEGRLSFTLGSAAPLAERDATVAADRASAWAQALEPTQRDLVLRPARQLKGAGAATPAAAFKGSRSDRQDRRPDYQPPPEQGRGPAAVQARAGAVRLAVARRLRTWLWLAVAGLTAYVAVATAQWWRLFTSEGRQRT
ncbi:MAG: hypothetical protein ABIL09_21385 [Gemmatimonadota bacterium]